MAQSQGKETTDIPEEIFDKIYMELKKNKVTNMATLNYEKIRSKEELEIEIRRQLPVFLEIINHKRRDKNEPKIEENQVIASTFVDIGNKEDMIVESSIKWNASYSDDVMAFTNNIFQITSSCFQMKHLILSVCFYTTNHNAYSFYYPT